MKAYSVKGVCQRFRKSGKTFSLRKSLVGNGRSLAAALNSASCVECEETFLECVFKWDAAWRQHWTNIVVCIRLEPESGVSATALNTAKVRWKQGIESTWNNKWAASREGLSASDLTFEVLFVSNSAHHTVTVCPGSGGTNVKRWFVNDSEASAAHEFGHMICHKDEYQDAECPKRNPVNTSTVMDNNPKLVLVPKRLMTRYAATMGLTVLALP